MSGLQFFLDAFLWPGEAVRKRLGISLEQDGGIIRSFVNMIVWGTIALLALNWMGFLD